MIPTQLLAHVPSTPTERSVLIAFLSEVLSAAAAAAAANFRTHCVGFLSAHGAVCREIIDWAFSTYVKP